MGLSKDMKTFIDLSLVHWSYQGWDNIGDNIAWGQSLAENGQVPRYLFHKGIMSSLSKSRENESCSNLKDNDQIRSQFCTCHDSSAVVACAKLWYGLIIRNTIPTRRIFTRFQLWAHKMFVRWVPGVIIQQVEASFRYHEVDNPWKSLSYFWFAAWRSCWHNGWSVVLSINHHVSLLCI